MTTAMRAYSRCMAESSKAIPESLAQRKSNLTGDAGSVSCIPFLMDSCIFGFLKF